MRKMLTVLCLVCGMISVAGAAPGDLLEKWALGKYVKNGKVDTGNPRAMLNVRSGPGSSYDVAGTLKDGDAVTVYAKKSGWVRITPDVKEGVELQADWASSIFIKDGKVSVGDAQSILNIRSGPGVDYDITKKLKNGAAIEKYEEKDGWIRISPYVEKKPAAAKAEKWVMSKYIKGGKVSTGNPQAVLNVRSGPGTTYDVAGTLKDGDSVTQYAVKDDWIRITASPNDAEEESGKWVMAKYVQNGKVSTGNPKAVLNVRSGPGTNYGVAGKLKEGDAVQKYDEKDGWLLITPLSKEKDAPIKGKWVLSKYIKGGRVSTGKANAVLNVRSMPGDTHGAVGQLKEGQAITEYARYEDWIRISPDPVADKAAPKAIKYFGLAALLLLILKEKKAA